MAINRFNQPVQPRVISQFVPQDMRLIAATMAAKQQRYDVEQERMEQLQLQHGAKTGFGAADQAILDKATSQLNELAQEYVSRDVSDPRIAKELRTKARLIADNPAVRQTQQTMAAIQQYKEARKGIKDWRVENDPFYQNMMMYQGAEQNGPLQFTGIAEGVDEMKTAAELFKSLSPMGQRAYARLGESFKEVGWQGHTLGQVKAVAGANVGNFANTAAGQQAIRRFRLMQQTNQQPVDNEGNLVDEEGYLAGILLNAGLPKVGRVETRAGGAGLGGGVGAGFPGAAGGIMNNVYFDNPDYGNASVTEDDFKEDGSLKGSGTVTGRNVIDNILKGDFSLVDDFFTNDDLNDEDKKKYATIIKFAEANNMTHKQAAERMKRKTSPGFVPIWGPEGKHLSAWIEDEGAGVYTQMKVWDQNGNWKMGNEFMRDMNLIDSDGELNEDAALNVKVIGAHDPRTGYIKKGYHVNVGGNAFLFEIPEDYDKRLDYHRAWLDAELKSSGVAETRPGHIIFTNPNAPHGVDEFDMKDFK